MTIIPNTTPWTLLVEVIASAETGDICTNEYPLIGWKIQDDEAFPITHGDHCDGGELILNGKLDSYAVLALHNPMTGKYRVTWGIGESSLQDLIAGARHELGNAQKVRRARTAESAQAEPIGRMHMRPLFSY